MAAAIYIADDEELARAKLRRALAARNDVAVIGEADNGETAVREIERLHPEILLLDVQMPGLNGFEVLRSLRHRPKVIFTTAHDHYAIEAFEVHSVDYLLKPYSRERLYRALDRALAETSAPARDLERRLHQLLEAAAGVAAPQRLACQKKNEIYFVSPAEIVWIESADTLTFVHTASDRFRVHRTLDQLERDLQRSGFVRAHRSALVNLEFIRKVGPTAEGGLELTVESLARPLPLSRRRARELRAKLGW
jgi:DNA-binding LytR/AlgR family response regulator